jgi:uncharacterized protein YdhG (YjbR/CyaY superfamily)
MATDKMAKKPPKSIDSYLASVPPDSRAALEKLRKAIKAAAPTAEEGIGYGMPGFKYLGRPLAYFAAYTKHCSFFPASGTITERFAGDLKAYETAKGTIKFSPDRPLPATLVRKLVKARMVEVEAAEAERAARRNKKR